MDWAITAFRENTQLKHAESAKILFYALKSVAALAFIFALTYLAGGGTSQSLLWTMIGVGTVIDLLPVLLLPVLLHDLSPAAKRIESGHIAIKVTGYAVIGAAFATVLPLTLFQAVAVFCTLWITGFFLEMAVLFYARHGQQV